MAIDARLKPPEVLAVAIRSEIEAADFYGGILGKVKNILLQAEAQVPRPGREQAPADPGAAACRAFSRARGSRFPDSGAGPKPAAKVDETSSVLDLFKAALEAEKTAEEYYRDARAKMADAGSHKILEYLSRVERSHFFMIRSEIDLLSRFPDYYDVEDFHLGQDLFHVGP